MKKTVLTIAIILGLGLTTFADPNGGGLFQRGASNESTHFMNRDTPMPMLPTTHNEGGNQSANQMPLGSGVALLTALGAAYLVGKRRREE